VTLFFAVFGTIIAIMKDIPDIIGDRLFSISSFSVRLGARPVFAFAWRLLFTLLAASSAGSGVAFASALLAKFGLATFGGAAAAAGAAVPTAVLLSRLAASVALAGLSKDVYVLCYAIILPSFLCCL
jgi:hypothetical protein